MSKLEKLNWFGNLSGGQGYSGSSEQTALALDKRIDVRVKQLGKNVPASNISKPGRKLLNKPFDIADVAVAHGFPASFPLIQDYKFRVGYTMFETDKLPDGHNDWTGDFDTPAEAINSQLDLLFVPCEHNVGMFRDNGVTIPIEVAPNGVHPINFPFMDRPKRGTFTFLMMATLTLRKNPGNVISAFAQLFADKPDVRLILKTTSGTLGHLEFARSMGNIEVIDEMSDAKRIKELMFEADCFVFPSRGEGFGMPPIEAMATGLPVILADNTGMKDYADDRYNYTVRFSHKSPAARYPKSWGNVGNWYESDFDDLKAKMLHVYENQAEAREKGRLAADFVREKFSYDVVADKFIAGIEKHYKP